MKPGARRSSGSVDVVVVGAGISGLVAARILSRGGARVCVLEARDRVGGKMHTVSLGGTDADLGAHWVGPHQRRITALAAELGVGREPQYLDGLNVLSLGGRRRTFTGTAPLWPPLGVAETLLSTVRLELRRRLVDRNRPWASRGAARLDSFSLEHWLRRLRSELARATLRIVARMVLGAEPRELSFLYFLWYLHSGGGYRSLTEFRGAAQDSHLAGGSQQICERLADELGDAVVLDSPVRSIEQSGSGVVVRSARSDLAARAAIVALSPALAARIAFEPGLPAAREALQQRMPMGAYLKAIATYERPWWRDRGLSGLAYAAQGPVQMTIDDSPSASGPGVLVSFVTGAPARRIGRLGEPERRRAVLTAARDLVGAEAERPASYRDCGWLAERWSAGGPVGLMGPGTLTTLGPSLREPVGRVHWAGTETAVEWNGYMEGGAEAGERAAGEVAARLGR